MNRMIRGMAGLLVALGASACADDPSVEFGGDTPTKIQASPTVMFVTQGVEEELLVRLVDDRNRSTATSFEISNVSAGLTVELDTEYRPDYIGSDQLEFNPIQHQHRYYVTGVDAVSGSFTVSSGGISQVITVRVIPTTLGAALSSAAPALGESVTITAPANLSFTPASTVTFTPGGAAIITEQTATTITFTPRPGSSGPATVTGVVMDYAPTLAALTLTTSNEVSVPAVTDIPGTFSTTSPAAGGTFNFTSPGINFRQNTQVKFGNRVGAVVGLSADLHTITVMPPLGLTGAEMTITNASLSFLPDLILAALPASGGSITTPGTIVMAQLANTTSAVAGSPTMTVGPTAPGAGLFDTGTWTGADALGGGGPNRWYRLTVTGTTFTRPLFVDWAGGADLDMYILNEGISAFVGSTSASAGSSQPETQAVSLPAASYWVVPVNWNHLADPAWIFLVVQ